MIATEPIDHHDVKLIWVLTFLGIWNNGKPHECYCTLIIYDFGMLLNYNLKIATEPDSSPSSEVDMSSNTSGYREQRKALWMLLHIDHIWRRQMHHNSFDCNG